MPSLARRRRTTQADAESEEEERPQTQTQTERRRRAPVSEDESDEEADEDGDEEMADAEPNSQDQVVKKLVRYALACEYQRTSIKRAGITEKVIGKQRGSNFRKIFETAQNELRTKFGMEMVELPVKEKISMKDKRAAANKKTQLKTTTSSYILTTVLPPQFRIPEIVPPAIIGSSKEEAAYMGLCTTIVSLISFSPEGALPDHKLMSYLGRFNTDENSGFDTTANTLKRMVTQGYIFKSVEKTDTDETTDWRVGPRGKIEIGNKGIQGLVRTVYGDSAPDDLDKRMQRSLGMEIRKKSENVNGEEEETPARGQANGDPGPNNSRGRGRPRRAANDN